MGTITDKDGYARYTVVVSGRLSSIAIAHGVLAGKLLPTTILNSLVSTLARRVIAPILLISEAVDSANGFEQYAELFCKAMFKDVSPQLDLFASI